MWPQKKPWLSTLSIAASRSAGSVMFLKPARSVTRFSAQRRRGTLIHTFKSTSDTNHGSDSKLCPSMRTTDRFVLEVFGVPSTSS